MNLRQLQVFVAIVDAGSFVGASEKLGMTTPAVSFQVRALESELGVSLFDRGKRPVALNSRGLALEKHARKLLRDFDQTREVVTSGNISGFLQIGAVPTALSGILPGALVNLRRRQPGIRIGIRGSNSAVLANGLVNGELDAAVLTEPEEFPGGYAWHEVVREPLVVIVRQDGQRSSWLETIQGNPFIWFNRHAWAGKQIARYIQGCGISVDTFMEVDSLEAIKSMVLAGLGVSVIPDCVNSPPLPDDLVAIPFHEPQVHRNLGVLHREDTPHADAIAALVRALQDEISD